jgi:hypothetical protein
MATKQKAGDERSVIAPVHTRLILPSLNIVCWPIPFSQFDFGLLAAAEHVRSWQAEEQQ